MKSALVIGHTGQDGSYLIEQLGDLGLNVVGVSRDRVDSTAGHLQLPKTVDVLSLDAIRGLLSLVRPDAIFYLAAAHHSSDEPQGELASLLRQSIALHVDGWLNVLEAVEQEVPACRSFYAASSHVFGVPETTVQDESTPFRPDNAYGITKAAGVQVARLFRARGQHVSAGFLYNHESPRRAPRFVSQRIARGAVAAARAAARAAPYTLEIGNASAVVDWGFAGDYTRAMWSIVSQSTPQDYVIASGVPHTVADFCRVAFLAVGLDWKEWVVERPERVVKQVVPLIGNPGLLQRVTGWRPRIDFDSLVRLMVDAATQVPS